MNKKAYERLRSIWFETLLSMPVEEILTMRTTLQIMHNMSGRQRQHIIDDMRLVAHMKQSEASQQDEAWSKIVSQLLGME